LSQTRHHDGLKRGALLAWVPPSLYKPPLNLQRGFRKLNGVKVTLDDWGASDMRDGFFCSAMVGAGAVSWGEPDATHEPIPRVPPG